MTVTEQQPRTSHDDPLDVRLAKVNAQAKAISRRGRAFQIGNEHYRDLHCNLDFLLACIEAAGE